MVDNKEEGGSGGRSQFDEFFKNPTNRDLTPDPTLTYSTFCSTLVDSVCAPIEVVHELVYLWFV